MDVTNAPAQTDNAAVQGQTVTAPQAQVTPAPAPTPASPSWVEGIKDPNLQGWAMNKGFHSKTPEDMANSYFHLEKLFGADKAGRTVEMPKDFEDTEGWNAVYAKLGRPASPDEYSFKVENGDENFINWAKKTFHDIGMSDRAAGVLIQKYGELAEQQQAAKMEMERQRNVTELESLRKEWGAAFDVKMQQIDTAATALGVQAEEVKALMSTLGTSRTAKLFAGIAEKLGEDSFVSADAADTVGVMTPAMAIAKRSELLGDKDYQAALLDKNHPAHNEAVEKFKKLSRFADGKA